MDQPGFRSAADLQGISGQRLLEFGRERNWISPEIQFLVRDRTNVDGTVFFPVQMDPGKFTLSKIGEDRFQLAEDLALEAWNVAAGKKRLHLGSKIAPVEDPLRLLSSYRSLQEGVIYCGYQQSVTLSDLNKNDIMCELWNLIQLNPGGRSCSHLTRLRDNAIRRELPGEEWVYYRILSQRTSPAI
jgi:hypothetical protein